ncbi:hypothetical protein [Streptomyces sp. NPDC001222]|uniref:hypothetical protein n=1 Tax=Streptomyces sp. NPDC001222 TaxID=3364548 RepID=UPI003691148D
MFDRIRKSVGRFVKSPGTVTGTDAETPTGGGKRTHNLFEAAAAYVAACAEDDQDRMDEAVAWVSPEALSFGVNELACRAVIALARERDESPSVVARTLLGLSAH